MYICSSYIIVRLINGSTDYEGRVEIYYNGVWGTVCDDGWDMNDAQVVCNELGYGKAIAALHDAFYGQGSGISWLNDVSCVGTELTIGDCSHRGWGVGNCNHRDDASVKCAPGMHFSLTNCLGIYVGNANSGGQEKAPTRPYSVLFTRSTALKL